MSEIIEKRETDEFGNTIQLVYNDGVLHKRITYNKKGDMVEEFYPGELRTCYKYNENGDEIECNQYLIYENQYEEHARCEFKKYDAEGRIIECEGEDIADGPFRFTYKYEPFEGKVLQKIYDKNGDLVGVGIVETQYL